MSRTVDPTEIRDTTDRLAHRLTRLDLGSCLPATLAELVTLGERIERLGHGLKTRAAARVAASAVWQGDGDRTPADWLARQTGTSKADAGRLVETGRQLEALPTVDGAVTRGELSARSRPKPSPVRRPRIRGPSGGCCPRRRTGRCASCRTSAAAPGSTRSPTPRPPHRRAHAKRSCRVWTDADGVTGHLHLSGPVAEVARVDNAIRHRADRLFRHGPHRGPARTLRGLRLRRRHPAVDLQRVMASPSPLGADAKIIVRIDHTALRPGPRRRG